MEGYLNHIGQAFGSRKVMDVTTRELVVFIEKYSEERGARAADRLKSYLNFGFAVERGIVQRSPLIEVTKRVTSYEKLDRDRVLSDDEIRMVWAWTWTWTNPEQGWKRPKIMRV